MLCISTELSLILLVLSMGQNNQFATEDRTSKRHLEVQSHAEEEHKFAWGYNRPAAPEAAQIREGAFVSVFFSGNLHPVAVDTDPGEMQQESGDQRMEARGSLPEPCPQRIQTARSRRPQAWTRDYNLM